MQNSMTPYDAATEKLVRQVQKMQVPLICHADYDMVQTVRDFRAAFRDPGVRKCSLAQKYEQGRIAQKRYSAGFCGIASYVWNHMFRMDDGSEIWRLKMISRADNYPVNHVWLENFFTGEPLDLTFDQFIDEIGAYFEIPYHRVGNYATSDFEFKRAYKFAQHLGMDLSKIVLENALRSLGRL